MRASFLLPPAALLLLASGCSTMAGAALGRILCEPGDSPCRARFLEAGFAADTGTITVGDEQYEASRVGDCTTSEGQHLVLEGAEAPYTCAQRTGAWACSCTSIMRRGAL
ncbi:MAG TPA: hypothetical protein VIL20_01540 [Sandaracinaceae bacterium]